MNEQKRLNNDLVKIMKEINVVIPSGAGGKLGKERSFTDFKELANKYAKEKLRSAKGAEGK